MTKIQIIWKRREKTESCTYDKQCKSAPTTATAAKPHYEINTLCKKKWIALIVVQIITTTFNFHKDSSAKRAEAQLHMHYSADTQHMYVRDVRDVRPSVERTVCEQRLRIHTHVWQHAYRYFIHAFIRCAQQFQMCTNEMLKLMQMPMFACDSQVGWLSERASLSILRWGKFIGKEQSINKNFCNVIEYFSSGISS